MAVTTKSIDRALVKALLWFLAALALMALVNNVHAASIMDQQGNVVGPYFPVNLTLITTPANRLISPTVTKDGFQAEFATAYFTSPDCSGQAYVTTDIRSLSFPSSTVAIPPAGGSIIYPDTPHRLTITVNSESGMKYDGTLAGCVAPLGPDGQPGSFSTLAAPLIMGTFPTFVPPFWVKAS